MGREVRRVPATWEHPKNWRGHLQPMFDEPFAPAAREWLDNCIAWDNGTHVDAAEHKPDCPFYWQWEGSHPDPEYYRPDWTDAERTHYQMYETASEGTPISPVMESPEALARWLADNGASASGDMAASYDAWLRVCRGGYACSMVFADGKMMSGVEAFTEKEKA